MADPSGRCLNCGAALQGAFCHRCGQEAAERRVPMRTLVADALGDLLAFDSRVLRTLRPLFLRPGFLTAEWCRGRRVPYVPPLRLYVFVAAIFFFVLAVTEVELVKYPNGKGSGGDVESAAQESPAEGASGDGEEAPGEPALEDPGTSATGEGADGREDLFARALEDGPEAFEDRFLDRFGRLSLMMPPLFALLVALVYRRRRRFFVEHLVFALHLHAFAFLVLSATVPLPVAAWDRGLKLAVILVLGGYLALALSRVYGGRRWVTAGRLVVLLFGYMLLVLLPSLLLAMLWTVWSAGAG